MSNLKSGNYRIVLKSSTRTNPMGLSLKSDHSSNFWCVVRPTSQIWTVTPLEGTDGFYLSTNQGSRQILSPHFGGADGQRINLGTLDILNKEFVLRVDDVGDGWVAINNHDKTRVFDAAGNKPSDGVDVICFKWNRGDNQRWKFIPV